MRSLKSSQMCVGLFVQLLHALSHDWSHFLHVPGSVGMSAAMFALPV